MDEFNIYPIRISQGDDESSLESGELTDSTTGSSSSEPSNSSTFKTSIMTEYLCPTPEASQLKSSELKKQIRLEESKQPNIEYTDVDLRSMRRDRIDTENNHATPSRPIVYSYEHKISASIKPSNNNVFNQQEINIYNTIKNLNYEDFLVLHCGIKPSESINKQVATTGTPEVITLSDDDEDLSKLSRAEIRYRNLPISKRRKTARMSSFQDTTDILPDVSTASLIHNNDIPQNSQNSNIFETLPKNPYNLFPSTLNSTQYMNQFKSNWMSQPHEFVPQFSSVQSTLPSSMINNSELPKTDETTPVLGISNNTTAQISDNFGFVKFAKKAVSSTVTSNSCEIFDSLTSFGSQNAVDVVCEQETSAVPSVNIFSVDPVKTIKPLPSTILKSINQNFEPSIKPPEEPSIKPPEEPSIKPPEEPSTKSPEEPSTKPPEEPSIKPPEGPLMSVNELFSEDQSNIQDPVCAYTVNTSVENIKKKEKYNLQTHILKRSLPTKLKTNTKKSSNIQSSVTTQNNEVTKNLNSINLLSISNKDPRIHKISENPNSIAKNDGNVVHESGNSVKPTLVLEEVVKKIYNRKVMKQMEKEKKLEKNNNSEEKNVELERKVTKPAVINKNKTTEKTKESENNKDKKFKNNQATEINKKSYDKKLQAQVKEPTEIKEKKSAEKNENKNIQEYKVVRPIIKNKTDNLELINKTEKISQKKLSAKEVSKNLSVTSNVDKNSKKVVSKMFESSNVVNDKLSTSQCLSSIDVLNKNEKSFGNHKEKEVNTNQEIKSKLKKVEKNSNNEESTKKPNIKIILGRAIILDSSSSSSEDDTESLLAMSLEDTSASSEDEEKEKIQILKVNLSNNKLSKPSTSKSENPIKMNSQEEIIKKIKMKPAPKSVKEKLLKAAQEKINTESKNINNEKNESENKITVTGIMSSTLQIYFQSSDYQKICCLSCGNSYLKIVEHYVREHPEEEVQISRLQENATKQAIQECNIQPPVNTTLCCRFCNFNTKDPKQFYYHCTLHTGEFKFKCSMCPFKGTAMVNVYQHFENKHKLFTNKVPQRGITIEHYIDNSNKFPAYICKVCNYLQMDKKNVIKHLKEKHNTEDLNNIDKINLATYIPEDELGDIPCQSNTRKRKVVSDKTVRGVDLFQQSFYTPKKANGETRQENSSNITISTPKKPTAAKGSSGKRSRGRPKKRKVDDDDEDSAPKIKRRRIRSEDVQCKVCEEWYYGAAIKTIWLQCLGCKQWIHENCTNMEDFCPECIHNRKQ